jgi:hypothetical protein
MRAHLRAFLAVLLLAGLTLPALAQKRNPPAEDADAVAERKASQDLRLQQEQERFNQEMARQMVYMRQHFVQEAINRMQRGPEMPTMRILGPVGGFLIFVILLGAVLWLVRTLVENRRWYRMAAVQTEIHTKLLEKFASSQELLAYMETEAGKHFLEASPFEVERRPSPVFPFGRILWSAQVGVVVILVGVAFLWLQNQILEGAQALLIFGTLGLALGVGLLLSAGFAYILAKSFGLLNGSPPPQAGNLPR